MPILVVDLRTATHHDSGLTAFDAVVAHVHDGNVTPCRIPRPWLPPRDAQHDGHRSRSRSSVTGYPACPIDQRTSARLRLRRTTRRGDPCGRPRRPRRGRSLTRARASLAPTMPSSPAHVASSTVEDGGGSRTPARLRLSPKSRRGRACPVPCRSNRREGNNRRGRGQASPLRCLRRRWASRELCSPVQMAAAQER